MTTNHQDVGLFHQRFGLDNDANGVGPRPLDPDHLEFRRVLMQEELDEFVLAATTGDYAGMADALIDLAYVVHGAAHVLGLPWQELWDDVQRANMSKVRAAADGSDSKRGSGFDVVKPAGWVGPVTDDILIRNGWPSYIEGEGFFIVRPERQL